ncbi:MAG: hypothetical protein V4574_19160 [Pseudomonadota bacterium]
MVLIELFRSNNANLISSAVQSVFIKGEIASHLERIRTLPGGIAAIAAASATLREAAHSDSASGGLAAIALTKLDPKSVDRAHYLAQIRASFASKGVFVENPEVFSGLSAIGLDSESWRELLDQAPNEWIAGVLQGAYRSGAILPGDKLRQLAARAFAEPTGAPPVDGRLWPSAAGFALLLLDKLPNAANADRSAIALAARAGALFETDDVENGRHFLKAAAEAVPTGNAYDYWVIAAATARWAGLPLEELVPLVVKVELAQSRSPDFAQLLTFNVRGFKPEALRNIREADTKAFDTDGGDLISAVTFLTGQGEGRQALEALCASPGGRTRVSLERFKQVRGEFRQPLLYLFDSDQIKVLRSLLAADPGWITARCFAQIRGASPELVKAFEAAATRDRAIAPYAAILTETNFGSVDPVHNCERIRRQYQREGNLAQASMNEILGYTIACRNENASNMSGGAQILPRDVSQPIARQLQAWTSPRLWSGGTSDGFIGVPVLNGSLDTRSAFRDAGPEFDYGALLKAQLVGQAPRLLPRSPNPSRQQQNAYELSEVMRNQGVLANLALLTKRPEIARWANLSLSAYRVRSRTGFDDVVAVMLLMADSIEPAIAREIAAAEFAGTADAAKTKALDDYRASAWRDIGLELAAAYDGLCGKGSAASRVSGPGTASPPDGPCISAAARPLAAALASKAREANSKTLADTLERWMDTGYASWFRNAITTVLIHAAVWLLLILVYPFSPIIQASFFWNPLVRKYAGLGYVQFALLAVPFFRDRLLLPFRDTLVADGRLGEFNAQQYFADLPASRLGSKSEARLVDLVPAIKGQFWIEAPSGAGKSWFLRNLAHSTRRPVAFLNATSCREGIFKAVAERCPGLGSDDQFLQSIIYAGGLRLIVDGLNEVDPGLRAQIVSFADGRKGCQIVIATQPVTTLPPIRATKISVHGLRADQMMTFMRQQAKDAVESADAGEALESRIRAFLTRFEIDDGSRESASLRELISNPMDLYSIVRLIAADVEPDLLKLQEQQVELARSFYSASFGGDFPMTEFSSHLYRLRLENRSMTLGEEEWINECEALREYKLVLRQDVPGGRVRWRFRHDKITDYFFYWTFRTDPDLAGKHLCDIRFIGAYVLLARHLPEEDAKAMLNQLFWAGSEEQDYTLSQAVVDAIRARIALQNSRVGPGAPLAA